MKTVTYKVYEFSELSDEAKKAAISQWYENEDYPMLEDNLTELVSELLHEKGISFQNLSVLYSLSCCQGDGLCFTGTFEKDENTMKITHSARYYYAKSVDMDFFDESGENIDEVEELKNIYFEICKKAEKAGYDELEYRMTFDEFQDHCKANNYTFTQSGKMDNA
jgi:hypothetical protein